jgi:hypothetical protein
MPRSTKAHAEALAKAQAAHKAAEARLKPIMDFRIGGEHVQVFILHPGDVFPYFGGSRSGLMVGKTPSLIVRNMQHGCQTDTEYDTSDHDAWTRILKAYDARDTGGAKCADWMIQNLLTEPQLDVVYKPHDRSLRRCKFA